MKRLVKFVFFLIVASGWPLALAAIHVVRTPVSTTEQLPLVGSMIPPEYGSLHIFTKERMSFRQTFADTRQWTPQDVIDHPAIVDRMTTLNLGELAKATVLFDPFAPSAAPPQAVWKTGMPPLDDAPPNSARSLVVPTDVPKSPDKPVDTTPHAPRVPTSQPSQPGHQDNIFGN